MTEDDLAVAIASALRNARAAGDSEHVRILAVTLADVAGNLARVADPARETCPALTHSNGRVDVGMVAGLIHLRIG